MSLLLPEAGLVFWMLIAFGIVFFILRRYGFPAIVSMVDERKKFIDDALRDAKEANEKLAGIEQQSRAIMQQAQEEQTRILREAIATREQLMKEAREAAEKEGEKILAETRRVIQQEKEDALNDIRTQVAELSISIAEKIIRKELSDTDNQKVFIDKLLDEAKVTKDKKK